MSLQVMELFSFMKQRKIVSGTVSNIWNRDKESVKNVSDILAATPNLDYLVKHPKSHEAKQLVAILKPFCKKLSRDIPYSKQSGATQITISISYGRFFGNGIIFLTGNPSILKQPMFAKLLEPVKNNNVVSLQNSLAALSAYEKLSLSERKLLQIANPGASALTYVVLCKNIFKHLLQFPLTHNNNVKDTKIMRAPWRLRTRGIFGDISAVTLVNELSAGQNNHFHTLLFVPFDYAYISKIAEDVHKNTKFGLFMTSLVVTEYPTKVWEAYDVNIQDARKRSSEDTREATPNLQEEINIFTVG